MQKKQVNPEDLESVARYVRSLEQAVRELLPWAEIGSRTHYKDHPSAMNMWNRIYDGVFLELLGDI